MSDPAPVRIITPQTGLDGFRHALLSLVRSFTAAGGLAWRLFLRDTRADHRQSLLGYAWLVAPVLANTLTWVFLNSQELVSIESRAVPYGIFVLSSVVLWTAFNGAVMGMLGVVPQARGVLSKVSFPQEALVYAAALKSVLDTLIAGLLVIPALFVFALPFTASMLLFPLALGACLVVGWALGLIVVPIAALYNDVSRGLQLALRFGFFLTPVIFALPAAGSARALMLLNPLTPLVVTGRSWLTGSGEAMTEPFIVISLIACLVILIGLVMLKVALPYVIERVAG